MTHTPNLTLAVFFTYGVSLELWEKRGMFSREVKFHEKLAREVGEIGLFTYGENDERYADQLGPNIRIFPKRFPLPNLLYAFVLPFVYAHELRGVKAVRINQLAGAIPALIVRWLFGKRLIVRGGFQWFTFAKCQGASAFKLAMISLIERFTYRAASAVIHTTQQDADFVRHRYGIDAKKLRVIQNCVDTDLFRPMDVKKETGSICFVGRLEPQKNLFALIEAMRDLDAQLVIYGEGSQRDALQERASVFGIRTDFRGRIANEELPIALNACEVFVLPSLYEGNPKVLLEAMSCGLPVIGTDIEGIRNIIRDNFNGLLCETNARSMYHAIMELLDSSTLRERLGHSARETIIQQASLSQAVQKEIQLLEV